VHLEISMCNVKRHVGEQPHFCLSMLGKCFNRVTSFETITQLITRGKLASSVEDEISRLSYRQADAECHSLDWFCATGKGQQPPALPQLSFLLLAAQRLFQHIIASGI